MIQFFRELFRRPGVLPKPHWACIVRNFGGRRFTTGNF